MERKYKNTSELSSDMNAKFRMRAGVAEEEEDVATLRGGTDGKTWSMIYDIRRCCTSSPHASCWHFSRCFYKSRPTCVAPNCKQNEKRRSENIFINIVKYRMYCFVVNYSPNARPTTHEARI